MYASNYVSFQAIGDPVFGNPVFNFLNQSHGQMETRFLVFLSIQASFSLFCSHKDTELRLIWQNHDLNIPQIPTYVTLKKRDSFPMFMVIISLSFHFSCKFFIFSGNVSYAVRNIQDGKPVGVSTTKQ